MTLKVLFCGAFDEGAGYPRASALRQGLLAQGMTVVDCRVAGTGAERRLLLRRPWRWPAWLWQEFRRRRALCRELVRAQATHRPDVIVVPYPGHLMAAPIRRHAGVPVVLDLFLSAYDTAVVDRALVPPGSLRAKMLRHIDRTACRAADLVLLDTEENARFLAELTGLPASHFGVVPIGDPASPAAAPPYQPPPRGELPILFFGTGVPLHGLLVLVNAVARCPAARLSLIGGTAAERAHAVARLGDRLELMPEFVARPELERQLGRAVLVAGVFGSSPKAQRVVPFKVVHALAFGRPVITADTPAMRRVVADGRGGFLVPAADANALATRLGELAQQPELLQQAAGTARAIYDRHFAVQVTGARLGELIRSLPRPVAQP